jgi:cell division transport system permease protein
MPKVDYVARETLTNLRRNLLLSLATIVTVAVSLSMVGIALIVRYGVDHATAKWKNGVEFEIFLNVDATPEQTDLIASQLADSPEVATDGVVYIDKQQQFNGFKQWASTQRPEYLDTVTKDDMPQSYRVKPTTDDADRIEALGQRFEQEPGVREVAFAADTVRQANGRSRAMQISLLLVAGLLFLASAFLIFNTIQTAIFSRRREIEVMKLVGATNWFIRVPFMVEGLLQGAVGALVAFSAVFFLREPLSRWIVENFDDLTGFYVLPSEILGIGTLVVIVGAAVGSISAGIALTRFLDV